MKKKIEDIVRQFVEESGPDHVIKEVDISNALKLEGVKDKRELADALDLAESLGCEIVPDMSDFETDENSGSLDSLSIFFREARRYKLLTPEEEKELGERSRHGDKDARNTLVNANLRLVAVIARRYTYCGEYADQIQNGNLGLMHAAEKFDPSIGCKFSTYAAWWIKQSIMRNHQNCGSTIRTPVYLLEKEKKIDAYIENYRAEHGRTPSMKMVAKKFDMPEDKLIAFRRSRETVESLDEPRRGDKDSPDSVRESGYTAEDSRVNVEAEAIHACLKSDIMDAMDDAGLTPKEKLVLLRHYGVDIEKPESMAVIGKRLGLTKERIRQIEIVAKEKIRSCPKGEVLRSWVS